MRRPLALLKADIGLTPGHLRDGVCETINFVDYILCLDAQKVYMKTLPALRMLNAILRTDIDDLDGKRSNPGQQETHKRGHQFHRIASALLVFHHITRFADE